MSELIAQLWTPQLQMAFQVVIIFLVLLYVLSIIWVVRDAYLRGQKAWFLWGIVALVPLLGVIAYCLLRPPLYRIDQDEQQLEVALKQRELMKYGECGNCGYPVQSDYVLCPNCHSKLKNLCPTCHHALEPQWTVCPYCAEPVTGARRPVRRQHPEGAAQQQRPQRQRLEDGQQAPARPRRSRIDG